MSRVLGRVWRGSAVRRSGGFRPAPQSASRALALRAWRRSSSSILETSASKMMRSATGQRHEPLAARAADQRQVRLACEIDAPRREPRARDEDRDAHLHALDDHLGGQATGGVEDLVVGRDGVQEHVAGNLVDGVVAADVLHVDEGPVLLAQHAAVDRAGLEVEARLGVDLAGQLVEPGGLESRAGLQRHGLELLHQVAEDGALGTARRLHLLLQLLLVVGFAPRAHDDGVDVVCDLDGGDLVVGLQHVLVQEVADSEQIGAVADGHHRHDLAGIEEQGQRAFGDDGRHHLAAVLVDARHADGQARVVGGGADLEFLHGR